ncbi:MAG: methyl-accepting chemotaxis protein [Ectothiorhodospiraceae bacterium]|nr:methyl-accepting chemotaxis protein [Ectothiorhodospiraceae bacterium]
MKGADFKGQLDRLRLATNVVGGLALLAVLLTVGSFAYVVYYGNFDEEYIARTEAVRVATQSVARNTLEAAAGDSNAFGRLASARRELENNISILQEGNPETGLPPAAEYSDSTAANLQRASGLWDVSRHYVDVLLQRQDEIVGVTRLTEQLIRFEVPQLEREMEAAATRLAAIGADPRQLLLVSQGLLAIQGIGRDMDAMSRGILGRTTVNRNLRENLEKLSDSIDSLLGIGPLNVPAVTDTEAQAALTQAQRTAETVRAEVVPVIDASVEIYQVHDAAVWISMLSGNLEADTQALLSVLRGLPAERPIKWWFGFVLGGLFAVLLVLRIVLDRIIAGRELAAQKAEKQKADEAAKKNQQAILDLLDEIQGLSEGDLTVQASVGEEFTGAIGDAFNDAIEALRSLVTTINETSVQVSSAAQQTQATAMHLAEASDHQAHQITAASAAINEMAVSIDEVSRNSEESADVARRSVDLAHKGADTVRRTIEGMDAIREQIQETSKRIKRLGESSQEIGNIVELINDIADQTNILALNASIQAAMAGEAGRGFAVVADEVQRLAERSGNATKQIEALVKTIQTDTNEAVISMEQSTAGVVSGARLAEDAGEALREIETTSQHLAGLIQNISEAARQQAKAAGNISDTMNVIQEITSQTSAGTNETATSIGNLADLANDLRNSVAGFTLPD